MKRFFLASLLTLVNLFSVIAQTDMGTWDTVGQTYTNRTYNLKWNLSELGEWNVASKEQMPPNHIFMAGMKEDYASVSIQVTDEGEQVGSVWNNASAFIDGFEKEIKKGNSFSGSTYGKMSHKKCHILFKEALYFEIDCRVDDARLGALSPLNLVFEGYAFSRGSQIIVIKAMFPKEYKEQFGDVMEQLFFGGLSYVNVGLEK